MLQVLKLFVASRNASIKEIHFPATLGPSYVYSSPGAIHGAVEKFLGTKPSTGPRGSLEEPSEREEEERQGQRSTSGGQAASPRAGDGLVPAVGSRAKRGRSGGPQGRRGLPGLLPDPAALGCRLRRKRQLRTHRQNPRVYHFKDDRRQPPRGLPDGGATSNSPTAPTTSGCRGSRAGRTRRSSTTRAKRGRSTVANTRSSSTAARSRWSPGTGAKTPTGSPTACSTRSPTTRWSASRAPTSVINPKPKPKRKGGMRDDEQREPIGVIGVGWVGPGDGRLLRRARTPGDRARHPPREGRGALRAAR